MAQSSVTILPSVHMVVCSMVLHSGTYVIFGNVSDLSGLPAHFTHAVMSADGASYFYSTSASGTYAAPTEGIYLSVGGFLVCTGDAELKLQAYQSSGVSKTILGSLGTLRLK